MSKKQKTHCDGNSISYPLSQPVRKDRRLSPSDSAITLCLPHGIYGERLSYRRIRALSWHTGNVQS